MYATWQRAHLATFPWHKGAGVPFATYRRITRRVNLESIATALHRNDADSEHTQHLLRVPTVGFLTRVLARLKPSLFECKLALQRTSAGRAGTGGHSYAKPAPNCWFIRRTSTIILPRSFTSPRPHCQRWLFIAGRLHMVACGHGAGTGPRDVGAPPLSPAGLHTAFSPNTFTPLPACHRLACPLMPAVLSCGAFLPLQPFGIPRHFACFWPLLTRKLTSRIPLSW